MLITTLRKLKAYLKSKALDMSFWMYRQNAQSIGQNSYESVLILPAADGWEGGGPYGFGDEMLMLGLLEGLNSKFGGGIAALRMDGQEGDVHIHGHSIKMKTISNGWFATSSYRQFAELICNYSHFVLIGADVLDGAYGKLESIQRLRLLSIASEMGVKTAITGCSFNGTNDKQIRDLLVAAERSGTVIHARDKVSLERFNLFLQNVKGVADLAFGVDLEKYPIATQIDAIMNRAAIWKQNSGIVVGLNLCGWHIKDKDSFFKEFIPALVQLANSNPRLGVILIPHDTREGNWSDLEALNELVVRLEKRIEVIGIPQDIHSGIDAKQVVGCCDALLTGRMHLAIAAHDQGIPSVCFGYQGKFEGFYGLYGMGPEWLVDYENPANAVRVFTLALAQRQELSVQIIEQKKEIEISARQNFVWLED